MRGMSRDKCGAATVAGFMATVAELKPKNVNVTAILSLVRNSVGSNAYVSDEIIYSRNGLRGMCFVFFLFLGFLVSAERSMLRCDYGTRQSSINTNRGKTGLSGTTQQNSLGWKH